VIAVDMEARHEAFHLMMLVRQISLPELGDHDV
jgi:hypothetical protein